MTKLGKKKKNSDKGFEITIHDETRNSDQGWKKQITKSDVESSLEQFVITIKPKIGQAP